MVNLGLDTPVCLDCNEGIFNPLCINCLTREIKSFFFEIDLKIFDLFNERFKDYFKPAKGLVSQQCVACKNKSKHTYCPYCFTEKVYLWLKIVRPELVKPFLKVFNFDFDKTGYYRELFT